MEQFLDILKQVDIKYLLIYTLIVIVLDIITGVWIAIFIEKNFESHRLQEGCGKKVLYLALLFITLGLDFMIKSVGIVPVVTRGYCIILITANIKSLFENCSKYVVIPNLKNNEKEIK